MKKNRLPIIIAVIALVVIFAIIKINSQADYKTAYDNTLNLKDYTMDIHTIVTLEDGDNVRQSAIDQTVKVKDKGKRNMTYQVETLSTSTGASASEFVTEENSYVYKNQKYFYDYPGVKYQGAATKEQALSNIENISNVISFSQDKMYNITEEDGEYCFQVENSDVSAYITAMVDFAAGQFENVNFTFDDLSVTATVKGKYVTERSFYLAYEGSGGQYITIEVYTSLIDRDATVKKIDESKYANILG